MQLYDKLLGLPLFQGMSSSDLQNVVAHAKIGFLKHNRNQVIVAADMPCKNLIFLLDGDVEVTTSFTPSASDATPCESITTADSFTVTEYISVPSLIEPECLFGISQRYTATYRTLTQCHFITISKDVLASLLSQYVVFRLNYLNILSTLAQRRRKELCRIPLPDTQGRVVAFLRSHCQNLTGKKVFRIKMQQLADAINDNRLDVSIVLNRLDDQSSIILQRGIITIPNIENLQV